MTGKVQALVRKMLKEKEELLCLWIKTAVQCTEDLYLPHIYVHSKNQAVIIRLGCILV